MKGVEAKWNSCTLIRTMSLMEHVESAKVQVFDCCSEREFTPLNMWMIGRSLKRTMAML